MDNNGGAGRIAVLIDADNASHRDMQAVLDEIAKYGNPTIKRVYGDWSNDRLNSWGPKLNSLGLRAMQQNAYTTGKNSTDLALVIDAMDLLYADNVEAFALVTSDSDFTSLAVRLRESGKTVYGLGGAKTPLSLQNACDKFIKVELITGTSSSAEPDPKTEKTDERSEDRAPRGTLQSLLTRAVNAAAGDGNWAGLSAVGNHLRRIEPSFDPREHGEQKLATLVAKQPYLVTETSGTHLLVGVKGSAQAPKAQVKEPPPKKAQPRKAQPEKAQPEKAQPENDAATRDAPTKSADKAPVSKATTTLTTRTRTPKA